MHIICFSNPQHNIALVNKVTKQLVIDHTDTVVVPPFSIPVQEGVTITDPKNPTGQTRIFHFPQVLMFIYFKGDVPETVKEIWAKQKAENSQKPE